MHKFGNLSALTKSLLLFYRAHASSLRAHGQPASPPTDLPPRRALAGADHGPRPMSHGIAHQMPGSQHLRCSARRGVTALTLRHAGTPPCPLVRRASPTRSTGPSALTRTWTSAADSLTLIRLGLARARPCHGRPHQVVAAWPYRAACNRPAACSGFLSIPVPLPFKSPSLSCLLMPASPHRNCRKREHHPRTHG